MDLDDLAVLKISEEISDTVWSVVKGWKQFERDTMGKQVVRSADSIGANISESFGRYHFSEKINFLYYARGSLFETKYWLNRALKRKQIAPEKHAFLSKQLNETGKQINRFVKHLRKSKKQSKSKPKYSVSEDRVEYEIEQLIFSEADLAWLANNHLIITSEASQS